MKKCIRHLLTINASLLIVGLFVFLFQPSLFGQTPLMYGDCIQESINPPAEIDVYTFPGNANDIVRIQASRTSGTFWPRLEIYQGGNLLRDATGSPTARIDTLELPGTGSYTILVLDGYDGSRTGSYGLSLQRTFDPGQATSITYGISLRDTLFFAAFINAYTFLGNIGDIITLQIARSSGTFWPGIELYSPEGNLLRKQSGSPSTRIDTLMLPGTGIYTILSADGYDGTRSGQYGIYLQRTFNPGEADTIVYGETISNSLNISAQKNTYVFRGETNDIITIQMTRTSGTFWPQIDLYSPEGAILRRETGSPTARIQLFTLQNTGYYTILTGDGYDGTRTGSYSLNLTKLPTSIKDTPIFGLPGKFNLSQNYPNPFNPSTTIRYQLPKSGQVELTIYNMLGEEVWKLVDENQAAGQYTVQWDGRDYSGRITSSGVYLYRLKAGEFIETKKMLLLR